MNNTELSEAICLKTYKFNEIFDDFNDAYHVSFDYTEGKGYFIRFPDCDFSKDRNLVNKNIYINKKSYCEIGFLLNKYKRYVLDKKSILEYVDDLLDTRRKKKFIRRL